MVFFLFGTENVILTTSRLQAGTCELCPGPLALRRGLAELPEFPNPGTGGRRLGWGQRAFWGLQATDEEGGRVGSAGAEAPRHGPKEAGGGLSKERPGVTRSWLGQEGCGRQEAARGTELGDTPTQGPKPQPGLGLSRAQPCPSVLVQGKGDLPPGAGVVAPCGSHGG